MAPRAAYGDSPLSPAERVRRSRWANRVEDTADRLLDLLNQSPDPLPRNPQIPPELTDKLKPFVVEIENETSGHSVVTRILSPGNGNQSANKKIAMTFVSKYFDAKQIDTRTVETCDYGTCHVAAFTHEKGAMINAPNRGSGKFGSRPWHSRDHFIMFRDVGDGSCIVYVSRIEPLFDKRTIGRAGVSWEDVEMLCTDCFPISAEEVLRVLDSTD